MKPMFSFVIAILMCAELYAQHTVSPNKKNTDQKIINNYLYQLNKQLVVDGYEGNKSQLTKARIDNLIEGSRDRYTEGAVTYSPDGRFKIFVLKGEMVGGHINCIYTAFIHSAQAIQNIVISPVERIFKLGANKYLIIQREVTCGGTIFYDYRKATVIALVKGKLVYYPFNYKYPAGGTNADKQEPDGSLILEQLTDDDHIYNPADSILLRFDPKTNKLQYRYRVDYSICCDKNWVATFSGFFQFENDRFIQKSESSKDSKITGD
ncbi:hypothetical protein FHW88_001138 [Mucilaginibacter sp. SG538B]|uniref:hypothetical protein n=1 Tax=unclassified Mucilaginibacter TaxID=2617802 RepID=UPI0008717B98|nr:MULTISPECIES: hypothetical protein [unclassified Mucilaginibacter]NVM62862.1 hypothetical protein [Mucilaginibacter sp. SG538B]SCW41607.1 hypothetical protein SAMN03159284_00463 [Mucilaginibacter sp. NFR10]